jgi:hypothetical protein
LRSTFCPRLAKISIEPTPYPEYDSRAIPTIFAEPLAFIPTPGVLDRVIESPIEIAPPSIFTLAGIRPERATGLIVRVRASGLAPPRSSPGFVEITPIT